MLTFLRKNKTTLVLIAVLVTLLSLAFIFEKSDRYEIAKADGNNCDSILTGGSSYSFNNDGIYFNYSIDNFDVLNIPSKRVVYAVFTNDDNVYNTVTAKNTFGETNAYNNNCMLKGISSTNYDSWFSNTFSNCTILTLNDNNFSIKVDSKQDLKKVFVCSIYHNTQAGPMHDTFDEYYVTSCSNRVENYVYESQMISSLEGNSISDNNRVFIQKVFGIYNNGANVPLNIHYKGFENTNGTGRIVKKTKTKYVNSLYLQNKEYIKKFISLSEADSGLLLSDFNVGKADKFQDSAVSSSYYLIRERGILEVNGTYGFTYHNSEYADVTINYGEFEAQDISLELQSNDPNYPHLKLYIQAKNSYSQDGRSGYIDFFFSNIKAQALNQLNWVINDFDIDYVKKNLTVNGFRYEYIEGTSTTEPALRVFFDKKNQEAMYNGKLYLPVEIVPNFYYDVEVNYTNFDFSVENGAVESLYKTDKYNFNDKITYKALINLFASDNNGWANFMSGQSDFYFPAYGDKIKNGIPTILSEQDILRYTGLSYSIRTDSNKMAQQTTLAEQGKPMTASVGVYKITVNYEFKPAFYITYNTKTNGNTAKTVSVLALSEDKADYAGSEFMQGITIDESHRLESITIPDEYIHLNAGLFKVDYVNPNNNKFSVKSDIWYSSNELTFIPVNVIISDEMLINFDYFEQYRDYQGKLTPFATITNVKDFKVKVADFKDITKPTASELYQVLSKNAGYKDRVSKDLGFLGLVFPIDNDITNITEKNQNGVFYYDIPYSYKSVKGQESNGSYRQVKVPMMKYSDWSMAFSNSDEPWGVEMLNHENSEFRLRNSDVKPEELYGLFASITFKEQTKSINDWFSGVTNNGCVVEFTKSEVKGSGVYQFLTGNKTTLSILSGVVGFVVGGPIGAAAAVALPAFILPAGCEIANNDNGTYYSHFFYLDGTTDLAFISNSKADSYDDNSSAIVNTGEDVADAVLNGDWFGFKPYVMILIAVLGAFAIIKIGSKGSNAIGKIKDPSVKLISIIFLLAVLALMGFGIYKLVAPSIMTLL